jgi:hypothetical protein
MPAEELHRARGEELGEDEGPATGEHLLRAFRAQGQWRGRGPAGDLPGRQGKLLDAPLQVHAIVQQGGDPAAEGEPQLQPHRRRRRQGEPTDRHRAGLRRVRSGLRDAELHRPRGRAGGLPLPLGEVEGAETGGPGAVEAEVPPFLLVQLQLGEILRVRADQGAAGPALLLRREQPSPQDNRGDPQRRAEERGGGVPAHPRQQGAAEAGDGGELERLAGEDSQVEGQLHGVATQGELRRVHPRPQQAQGQLTLILVFAEGRYYHNRVAVIIKNADQCISDEGSPLDIRAAVLPALLFPNFLLIDFFSLACSP